MMDYYLKGIKESKRASLLSRSFGRAVGVAILNKNGTLISEGFSDNLTNSDLQQTELPKFDGQYDRVVQESIIELAEHLCQIGVISNNEIDSMVNYALENENKRSAQASSPLLHFSKTIHAEISALISAEGSQLKYSSMFSTLEPCKNCLKYIAHSGIYKVYYIEHNGYSTPIGKKVSGIELYEINLS